MYQNNGGACTACECNERAETCNTTTGFCIDCEENTAGMECDICGPGYFGNPMIEACQGEKKEMDDDDCSAKNPGAKSR